MILLYIILGLVAVVIASYVISYMQMTAWLHSLENHFNNIKQQNDEQTKK